MAMKRDIIAADEIKPPLWFEAPVRKSGQSLKLAIKETEEYRERLSLLYRVGKKVGEAVEVSTLLGNILDMTYRSLRAAAASLLLIDKGKRELYFEVAAGEAGETLPQLRLSIDSGIAGWVARHGRAVIANDVSQDQRFNRQIDKLTGFVTRSILAVPLVAEGEVFGVLEVLNQVDDKGFNEQDLELLMSLASMASVAISNDRLHHTVIEGYKSTVRALAAAIDAKDPYTCGHSQRVTEYALMGASSLDLPPEALQAIEFGGMLHDVGKIGIHDSILRKPGTLTPEEWSAIINHPLIGAHIIEEIHFLDMAKEIVLYHHERYDGTGYPNGIKGESIPIGARLMAVADAFDAMTTERSYRAAQPVDDALRELGRFAGTQFCPVSVKAFVSAFRQHREAVQASSEKHHRHPAERALSGLRVKP
ncbi:MAG: HD domain-containing phosphohydrolase [Chloroflexota bacterium]